MLKTLTNTNFAMLFQFMDICLNLWVEFMLKLLSNESKCDIVILKSACYFTDILIHVCRTVVELMASLALILTSDIVFHLWLLC